MYEDQEVASRSESYPKAASSMEMETLPYSHGDLNSSSELNNLWADIPEIFRIRAQPGLFVSACKKDLKQRSQLRPSRLLPYRTVSEEMSVVLSFEYLWYLVTQW